MHKQQALNLIDRAGSTGRAYAVFLARDGCTKVTNTGTDLFAKTFAEQPDRLIGIYDENARAEWIVNDVAYHRSCMSCAA